MKYGVIYYKDTDNIGDDIQSYAASRFLPKIDYYIDREHLSEFVPNTKEVVKAISNGWFNHDKMNFLYSPYIYPLLVSMHFSQNDLITERGYDFLDGYAKKYISKFGPVGCRDHNTEKTLNKMGYETFFSACLTLTIDPIGTKKQKNYICAVDLKPEIINHLKEITNDEIKEVSHWLIFDKKVLYEEKRKIIEEYTNKTFDERKEYVKKNSNLSFDKRMENVEKILKIYQNAKLVVTDRIHVALPCLALNTPVLFIYYPYNSDRVETFKDFLINYTEEEFLKLGKEKLKIKNKSTYLKYRERLKKICSDFINEEPKKMKLPEIEDYKEFVERTKYMKKIYLEKIYNDRKTIDNKNKEIERLEKVRSEVEAENEKLKKIVDEYNRIKSSKTWHFVGKYYNRKLAKKQEGEND